MPEDETTTSSEAPSESTPSTDGAPAKKAAAKKTTAKKTAAKKTAAKKTAAKKTTAKKAATKKTAAKKVAETADEGGGLAAPAVLFQVPDPIDKPKKKAAKKAPKMAADQPPAHEAAEDEKPAKKTAKKATKKTATKAAEGQDEPATTDDARAESDDGESPDGDGTGARRRRRRGGRRRRKTSDSGAEGDSSDDSEDDGEQAENDEEEAGDGTSRRRRRRRRTGEDGGGSSDDPSKTATRVRRSRTGDDQITAVSGSTRLEAKKQRRREGREAGRRRAPIVSEAEFLARREAVDRVMVVRQRDELTQIGVLEDKVLVEHYVARESQTSLIGNVYLGRVQNVLPSMEAAFIDIGRGRNAVLYAGEVNWSALGHKDGQQRKIESVLSSGQSILVQVSKDPIGHKGARLTSQISLAGRFLVYVPDGTTSGISRKLPDTERNRLKSVLKEIVPDTAGVIVRTAAEGASEDELTRDVERLKARWEDIEKKSKGSAPQLLYGEPDLTLKVVRDLFTEDFGKLVIQGDDAWETVQQYVAAHGARPAGAAREVRPRGARRHRPVHDVPPRRADRQGARPQGLAALRRLAGHRPHRGDDRRRRQHRQVHRLRRQPRGDGHQEQPGGGRGDRPPAPAPRHRRHHRRGLHRHGARVEPRPRAPPAGGVPGSRPDPPPGRRGHLARPGADDPQADRHRAAGGVQRDLRALPGPGPDRPRAPGRGRSAPTTRAAGGAAAGAAAAAGAEAPVATATRATTATGTAPRRPRPRTSPRWPGRRPTSRRGRARTSPRPTT